MKETLEKQWALIQMAPLTSQRVEWLRYCKMVIDAVSREEMNIRDGAYSICGIGARVMDMLNPADTRIMDMACILELPPGQQEGTNTDWPTLVVLVEEALSEGESAA